MAKVGEKANGYEVEVLQPPMANKSEGRLKSKGVKSSVGPISK